MTKWEDPRSNFRGTTTNQFLHNLLSVLYITEECDKKHCYKYIYLFPYCTYRKNEYGSSDWEISTEISVVENSRKSELKINRK